MKRENIRIGQDITLVSKGIRHDYGETTYNDYYMTGDTHFIKITRIGTKYLYGTYFYFDQGERKESRESQFDFNEYIILDGIRQDLQDKYQKFRQDCNEYEERKRKADYEIDHKCYEFKRAEQDAWQKMNPRPEPISLASLECPYNLQDSCGNAHNCNVKVCQENRLLVALSTKGDS